MKSIIYTVATNNCRLTNVKYSKILPVFNYDRAGIETNVTVLIRNIVTEKICVDVDFFASLAGLKQSVGAVCLSLCLSVCLSVRFFSSVGLIFRYSSKTKSQRKYCSLAWLYSFFSHLSNVRTKENSVRATKYWELNGILQYNSSLNEHLSD